MATHSFKHQIHYWVCKWNYYIINGRNL